MQKYDYLIVGAGLYGAVAAWKAAQAGARVLVVDKRNHIGGNTYCEKIEGINVHKYGAHIFHTSDKQVWDFVNSFAVFNRYTNSPIAYYQGELYNMPFNMNTFYQMWRVRTPQEAQAKVEEQRARTREMLQGRAPANLEEQALMLVGEDIYKKLIKGYTEKQWGRDCTALPAFIIKRLPLRFTFDNNYFNDLYQGIPIGGYNELTNALLSNAEVRLNCDFFELGDWRALAKKLIYTGPLDRYFDYKLGKLEYRSLRFDTEIIDAPDFQGNAVVNYTDGAVAYTRIIEHKHFEMFGDEVQNAPRTVISKEYPEEWHFGAEPYYPINDERNNALAERYRELAKNERDVTFGGRLADYRYYDMDDVVAEALAQTF